MTTRNFRLSTALVVLFALANPAIAEVDLTTVNSCLTERLAGGEPPATCIDDAQVACMNVSRETPAVATLCFVEAEQEWQAAIASLMKTISQNAPEEIAAIAGIEARYDLLSALLQCNRMEELSLAVGRETGEAIQRQNAHCKANAAGLTYARIFLRSRDLR